MIDPFIHLLRQPYNMFYNDKNENFKVNSHGVSSCSHQLCSLPSGVPCDEEGGECGSMQPPRKEESFTVHLGT